MLAIERPSPPVAPGIVFGEVAHVIDSVEDDKNFSKIYGGEYGKEWHQAAVKLNRELMTVTEELETVMKEWEGMVK